MSNRILVTYASRAGSTVGVAEAIARTLREYGLAVDLQPMDEVREVASYQAVVAGSAVRMDRWLPEAMQFLERHQHELARKPFAAFVVCLALAVKNDQRGESAASSYLRPVRALVLPVSEGLFAGSLDLKRLPLHYRLAFGSLILARLFKQGDFRDWDAIRQWAQTLPPKLMTDTIPLTMERQPS